MPIYNFQQRFWPFVKDGTKTHTIRTIRRYACRIGQYMYLYGGLRQPGAKRLILPPVCTAKKTIFIMPCETVYIVDGGMTKEQAAECIKDENKKLLFGLLARALSLDEKINLAWHDGFRDQNNINIPNEYCWRYMFKSWKKLHPLPFAGHIDIWDENPQALKYLTPNPGNKIMYIEINERSVFVGDRTRYGIIKEFVSIDGTAMMRSDNPFGTWPIEIE